MILLCLIIVITGIVVSNCTTSAMSDDQELYGDDDDDDAGIIVDTTNAYNDQVADVDYLEPGKLTAGEWRDHDNWSEWTALYQRSDLNWHYYRSKWRLPTDTRYVVTISYNSTPSEQVPVTLFDGNSQTTYSMMTDNSGDAYCFPGLLGMAFEAMSITVGSDTTSYNLTDLSADGINSYTVDQTPDIANVLDLMFVIDTTGSMSDELEYLKVELEDVIKNVKADAANLSVRLSCNYYRDFGDEYVVRSSAFTTNISSVINTMQYQIANGGGDFPEAVHLALDDALNNHLWSVNARERLLFLVLDAPPHSTGDVVDRIRALMIQASTMGVRIIPVAASGIDKETEFLLRSMALITNGTYIFLTDHSSIGNEHLEPSIGQYDVEYLNDLLIKVIKRYANIN